METQLQTMEIPILELSSPGCQVGGVGKLVNNAGEPKRGGINAGHRWAEEDFFFDAAGSAHEKKDSSAKNTLKGSLSSHGGSREDRSPQKHPIRV